MNDSRVEVIGVLTDKYDEERTVHRRRNGALCIKRKSDTAPHALNRTVVEEVCERISCYRKERGLTYAQLADRAGTPGGKQRGYSLCNPDQRGGFKFGTLYAVALALDVEVADLLPDKGGALALSDAEWVSDRNGERVLHVPGEHYAARYSSEAV